MALGAQLRKAREARGLTASEVAAGTNLKVQIVEDLEREDFHRVAATIYGKGFIKLYAEYVGLEAKPLIEDYLLLISPDGPAAASGEGGMLRQAGARRTRRVRARLTPDKESADDSAPAPTETSDAPTEPSEAAVEPDLFEAAVQRRKRRTIVDPSVPPVAAEPGRKRVHSSPHGIGAVWIGLRKLGRRALEALQRSCGAVRTGCVRLAGRVGGRLVTIRFDDVPLKTIAVAIGVAVLLLLVVSVTSRCARDGSRAEDAAYPVAVEVPEPYFE
jgi:transcriptional regulator with XRE-family HTH domain